MTETIPNPSQFPVWQSRLPGQLGVDLDVIRGLREKHLEEGADWVRISNRVMLSEGAVGKLRELLQSGVSSVRPEPRIDPNPPEASGHPPEVATPPSRWAAGARPRLVVSDTWPRVRARHLVQVKVWDEFPDPKAQQHIMRVRDNEKFHINGIVEPGDYEVAEAPREGWPGIFDWVGRYPPRRGYFDG